MIAKYNRLIVKGGISALILQTVCYALIKDQVGRPEWLRSTMFGAFLLASVLIVSALFDFAKTKSHHSFLGILLGFAGCWGLLVFAGLPGLAQPEPEVPGTPQHRLKGLITDPDGKPDPGAQVAVFLGVNGRHWIKAGAGGEYILTWSLEPWREQHHGGQILVRDPARGLAAIEDLPADTTNLDIKLKAALTLTGLVKNAANAPLPGAQVGFQVELGNGYHRLDDPVQPADAQGRYEIKCLPADRQYLVYASAKGYGTRWRLVKNATDTGRLELSPLVLQLADQVIAGQVLMDNDQPVAGVNVNMSGMDQSDDHMTTDSQGRFHFQVCAGQIRLFAASPRGGGSAQDTAEAGDTNVILRLGQIYNFAPGARIHKLRGLVVDTGGKLDPEAQVAVFPGNAGGAHWVKTGLAGEYNLTWAVPPWQLQNGGARLVARDLARSLAAVADLSEDATNLGMELKPALTLTGQVKNAAGAPMPGAQVSFSIKAGSSYNPLYDQVQPTDAQGRYETKCLPADGQYMVYASAKGYGKSRQTVENDSHTNRLELSPLVLQLADQVIAGQVLQDDDKPAADADVRLSGEGQPDGTLTTDRQGRFQFQVCPGQIRLDAYSKSSGGNAQATVEAGDTNVVLWFEPEASARTNQLKGLVTDADGKPDPGARVALFSASNGGTRWVNTGPDGEYTLTWSLEPWQAQNGGRQIIVRDRARGLAALEDLPEDTTNLDLKLKAALALTGQVSNAADAPMPGAQLGLLIKEGNLYRQWDEQLQPADAQGRYEIKCLPADGQYAVYASAEGYGRSTQPVENSSNTNRLELSPLVLKPADQVIAGQVLMDNDQPVGGVNVNLGGEGQPSGHKTTDSQGRFQFQVCAGQIRLFAFSPYGGGNAQATAEAGDTNIVITLTTRPGMARQTPGRHSLKGGLLPNLAAVNLAGDAAPAGKPVLMCLFDATQRPSRQVIQLLDQQAAALAQKNVRVLGVQAAILRDDVFNQWKTGNPVSFPVGRVTEKSPKTKWASSVTALPWLILTDASHRVVAEGFSLDEVDAQIQTLAK